MKVRTSPKHSTKLALWNHGDVDSRIKSEEVAVMTDIPQRTIEREISALQKMSVLQRVGAPRTGKWAIKKDIDIELI